MGKHIEGLASGLKQVILGDEQVTFYSHVIKRFSSSAAVIATSACLTKGNRRY